MSDATDIRDSLSTDGAALEDLYGAAFPDENLIPLLRDLLGEKEGVFSFVAMRDGALAGHIVFSMCRVGGRDEKIALLGPLTVSPRFQRQGIGGTLIHEGLRRVTGEGATQVLVLGDPAYYGRFGFEPECRVSPPYDLPQEWRTAWQSVSLSSAKSELSGTLFVPKPWHKPELWAP
ncbi:MAG: N-acetyltransferase [Hyphomicrobiaceae bacterium]|nr:N-acetyltransferase [Hyphomicrobiaceae bacterium]